MLRIIQNRAAASAKSYYAHSDYLSEGQELTGRWGGRAAAMLGLSGDVDKISFDRLCDNLDPRSGKQLTLRTNDDRTVGYDFNFHLPKGVSLAYSLGKDERILGAFQASVDETMAEIELEAKTRVRKHGAEFNRITGNLVWAQFIHKTARPVNGEPDPHVHAHCFVMNTTWDQKEQAWKAGQFRDLKRDAPYFEAAFHARMALRMRELGYEIRRDGKAWDIAEIPKSVAKKFSRRTDQIEELAREAGITSDAEKDGLAAKSREKKQTELSMPELRTRWNERLDDPERKIMAQLSDAKREQQSIAILPEKESASLSHAEMHCFERHSVVPMKTLLAEGLRHGVGHVSVEGMHRQLDAHRIIRRDIEDRMMATTVEVLSEEQQMLQSARSGLDNAEPLNAHWEIQQSWLNADQQAAVQHVLNAPDKLIMIRGGAGTGKTSLMKETVAGIEAGGRKVFTFAPSSQASRGVLKAEGFEATTVAELLVNEQLQRDIAGQAIWIDEAGLLGTRTLKSVMDLAEKLDARVILSGDWRQHGSVDRGAAMRLLEQQAGIRPAVVREIQRQKGMYRDAVALLSEGLTQDGFDALHQLGWVKEIADEGERYGCLANDFAESIERGETVLATAPTHAESELLSATIRQELVQRGYVGKDDHELMRLKPLRLTQAEKADGERIAEGDVIVFHQNAKGIKRGQRFQISEGLPKNLKAMADRFDVYRQESSKLASGDLIRFTSNGKTKDGKHRLNNGAVYRISSFTDKGDIRLENGWLVDRDYGFLSAGYVSTSHASQGRTVDHVLIAESAMSYSAAGREQFYVSVSRGKRQATIYTDSRVALADAVGKTNERMGATELLNIRPKSLSKRSRQATLAKQQPEPGDSRKKEIAYDKG